MPCNQNIVLPGPGCTGHPIIDVAVIDVSLNPINIVTDGSAHLVILDSIDISSNIFHAIFYDSSGDFSLNPNYDGLDILKPYVGISNPYRTKDNGHNFCLIDTIFDNIECDLGVCRTAFTPCTNIALNKQLAALKTFYDLGLIKLECSLSWSEIINVINCAIDDLVNVPPNIIVDLVISIVFTTPTIGVYPTIIKLIYSTDFPIIQYPLDPTLV